MINFIIATLWGLIVWNYADIDIFELLVLLFLFAIFLTLDTIKRKLCQLTMLQEMNK